MQASDWIVNYLISCGASDAFGLPGAVILDLLYAMERRRPVFTPHLTYHEQGGAFAACGYAQATGRLGVAYATRGPGMLNMVTAIADAYYDSLPVVFFTAHNSDKKRPEMRIENNQEMDSVSVISGIAKYAVRIDDAEMLQIEVEKACSLAVTGRKGPVFLDIHTDVFRTEIEDVSMSVKPVTDVNGRAASEAAEQIAVRIRSAKRPVFLFGNGIRQSSMEKLARQLASQAGIPVLSSRTAQDVLPQSSMYFGFIGSHATRYSNFILSKADVIVTLGNRMAFPVCSKSFRPVAEHASILRIDADKTEFLREIPNSINYHVELGALLPELLKMDFTFPEKASWLSVCGDLKRELKEWDKTNEVEILMHIIRSADEAAVFVCDVGNHSFWVTTAYIYAGVGNRILYSGSFGSLGSALPKAAGVCYGTKKPVVCFIGDQGFQMNIQELQFISQHRLPITIVVLNNFSSGMIRERQERGFGSHFVHTTLDSGYSVPDLQSVAHAYGLEYDCVTDLGSWIGNRLRMNTAPYLIEVKIREDAPLYPWLPAGNACQDMFPLLPRDVYQRLNRL